MAAFTSGPGSIYYLIRGLMWIWSPLSMYCVGDDTHFNISPITAAFFWSVLIGFIFGFAAPLFRSKE